MVITDRPELPEHPEVSRHPDSTTGDAMLDRHPRRHADHPLAKVSLFQACTPAELATIVSVTTLIDVASGRVLCQQGERGDEFFVIVDGEAAVTVDGNSVAILGPGQFFGELALLDGGPRIATVT